jgi:hypothetical protein
MKQPSRIENPHAPHHICKLDTILYELKRLLEHGILTPTLINNTWLHTFQGQYIIIHVQKVMYQIVCSYLC